MSENTDNSTATVHTIRLCSGCGKEIDPDWCWCGDKITHSPWSGHEPVPMGCICGYVSRSTVIVIVAG